jgi:hypothetical protein
MGLKTSTTWSAHDWNCGNSTNAELEAGTGENEGMAVLTLNYHTKIRLGASELRELARAAELIAEELEEN